MPGFSPALQSTPNISLMIVSEAEPRKLTSPLAAAPSAARIVSVVLAFLVRQSQTRGNETFKESFRNRTFCSR